jgi:O-antigen/teichoic acid export membrane protein
MIQISARGSMILIIGQMFSSFISAAGTILVARTLGSQSFGILNIALVPVSVALLLINNGSSQAIIKFIAESRQDGEKKKIQEIVLCGFIINITVGFVIMFILFISAGIISNQVFKIPELMPLLRILSTSIFSQALISTSSAVIIGFEKMEQSTMVQILYSTLKSIIGPLLVFLGYGIAGAAIGYSLPYFISSGLGIILVAMNLRGLKLSFDLIKSETFYTILNYAYPLFLSTIVTGGLQRFLDFLLSINVSADIMGNYSAAISFSILIGFFTNPISTATFPLLSKIGPKDSVFEFVYQSILKYESMIIFPVTFTIIALSYNLVTILYGASYTLAPLFLQIYIANFFLIGIGSAVNPTLLNSQNQTKVNFFATLITLIFGVPLGLVLIPQYGVIGFLIIWLTAKLITVIYSSLWIKKNYQITVNFEVLVKIFASSAIGFLTCTLFLTYFNTHIWIELVFGATICMITYLILILYSGALTKKNLEDMNSITKQYHKINQIMDPIFKILKKIARK